MSNPASQNPEIAIEEENFTDYENFCGVDSMTREEVDNLTFETDDMNDLGDDIGGGDDKEEVPSQSKKRIRKEVASRSQFWEHFVKFFCDKEKIQKAKCIYCLRIIKADPKLHGTKALKNHFEACKKRPHEVATNQTRLAFQSTKGGDKDGTLVSWRFEQDKTREAMSYWLIVDELPFKTIENPGFRHFMSVACPMFIIPSRRTITKDIYNLYVSEKAKLKSFIKHHAQTVCITTDTWTSIQKVNYMCLTVHFVDDDWNLRKRILNFCPILGHKSEEVGKGVEKCLLDWGIDKVYTVTVDNASSNDGAILYLKKRLDAWGTSLMGGQYLHMRCVAHIINLMVQDGLKNKEEHDAICRIRGAIRYIKNSPARYKKFQEAVEFEKIESKKLLSLDVPTRWNSTYLMLESALSLREAFDRYMDMDLGYKNELSSAPNIGIPKNGDWNRAELLCKFLAHFYKLTLCVSGSLYVTANMIFHEISSVDMLLREWLESEDWELRVMSERMKQKFDKYWGAIEKMNSLLYFAVILDPRHKWEFLDFSFDDLYGDIEKSALMKEKVTRGMQDLFGLYKLKYGNPSSPKQSSSSSSVDSLGPFKSGSYLKEKFKRKKQGNSSDQVKSELQKYLSEDQEEDEEDFDILKWWKVNAPRFPILSKLARDIMAVPVSTVASEAAFSTGGRILDAFRSSLSPRIVQALICGQDWLRSESMPLNVEEDLCDVESLEQELASMGIENTIVDI